MSYRSLYSRYERHITTLAFVSGFVIDNITMVRVDKWYDHVILIAHLIVAITAILLYNAYSSETTDRQLPRTESKLIRWLPILIQFGLGSVFSGSLVFYTKGASLSVSWPFLILLAAFFIANERVHTRYGMLVLQLTGLFVALFLYASFSVPILMHQIGIVPFLVGGLASLCIVSLVTVAVRMLAPERFEKGKWFVRVGIGGLYLVFTIFYITNLIPPLPLSLREIGIYHSLVRDSTGQYIVEAESHPWYDPLGIFYTTYHVREGDPLIAFSSIYVPLDISTNIMHVWSYRDPSSGRWIPEGQVVFTISGGRDSGYRGYSLKNVSMAGDWRVDVMTLDRHLIGRSEFTVENVAIEPQVVTEIH